MFLMLKVGPACLCYNIDPLKVIFRKAAYSFRKGILEYNNKYIQIITNSVYFYQHSSFTNNWCKELFKTT